MTAMRGKSLGPLFGKRPIGKAEQWIYDCAHLARTLSTYAVQYTAWGDAREADRCRRDAWRYLAIARNAKDALR